MRLRTLRYCVLVYALLNLNKAANAQCGSGAPLTATYNASEHINFGDASSTYTFPQFDPSLGTLLKVDIDATINGQAVDYLENNLNVATNYTVQVVRWDSIAGPNLGNSMSATSTKNYGPFSLGASDNLGIPNFNGPDFIQLGPDILPNNKIFSKTLNGGNMSPYIGVGNVSFDYHSSARAVITGSANNTNTIAASTDITLQVTYTYCPLSILPIENLEFNVRKTQGRSVKVIWTKSNEQPNIQYAVEVSNGTKEFDDVATIPSKVPMGTNIASYEYNYLVPENMSGRILFRLKQTEFTGAVNYSIIKTVDISVNDQPGMSFSLFPNPTRQDIQIQFSSIQNSTMLIELVNSIGQVVESSRTNTGSDLIKVNFKKQYQPGIYFLRLRNLSTNEQSVSKLVIR